MRLGKQHFFAQIRYNTSTPSNRYNEFLYQMPYQFDYKKLL